MSASTSRKRTGRSVKMVITGPYGAGKTSLIKTISEIDVLSTEKSVSEPAVGEKAATTVAMDFGRLTIDDELALFLFGTPGQKRFDFMWEILAEGMLGFVVLVDHGDPASLSEAQTILTFFRESASVPYVVAVNKVQGDEAAAVEHARGQLDLDDAVRVVACDARERESVKSVLLELLYAVLDEVEQRQAAAV